MVTRRHETFRTNTIVNRLKNFSNDLKEEIEDKTEDKKKNWRNDLNSRMTKVLRKHFDDDRLKASMIRRVTRKAIEDIDIPDFEYDNQMPPELKPQGVLKDDAGQAFFDAACDYAEKICRGLKSETRTYIKRFASEMKNTPLERLLLEQFQKELASLEKSIENKEMELKRINLIKGELERIE